MRPSLRLLTWIAVAAILLWKCWNAYRYPVLWAEDGPLMYARYVNDPSPAGIWHFYGSYVSLLPNTVGWLASLARPTLAPYWMGLYALVLATAAYSLFSLRRFRVFVASDRARAALCVCLALAPVGNAALLSGTTYSLWHLLLVLLLSVAAPLPRSRVALGGQLVFCVAAAWSHPASLLALPLCAVGFLRARRPEARAFHGALALAIAGYLLVAVAPSGAKLGVLDSLSAVPRYFLERVVLEGFTGRELRLALVARGLGASATLLGAVLLASLVGLGWWRWRSLGRTRRAATAGALGLALGLTAFCVVGRGMTADSHFGPWEQRYFYLPQLLLWLVAMALGYDALRRSSRVSRLRGAAVAAATLILALALTLWNSASFATPRRHGELLADFLGVVEARLHDPTMAGRDFLFPRERWAIRIHPRLPGAAPPR